MPPHQRLACMLSLSGWHTALRTYSVIEKRIMHIISLIKRCLHDRNTHIYGIRSSTTSQRSAALKHLRERVHI